MGTVVDVALLRQRLMVPTSLVSDEELASYLDTCLLQQQEVCDAEPRTEALENALIRRVRRMVAARTLPLGAQDTEYGQAFIPRWDPILQELEGPYLRGGFA